jgi:HAD superfamily hydrolase (TIGR01509 family)
MVRAIIFDYYGVLYLDAPTGRRLNTELAETIRRLKASYKLAVLSNTSLQTLDKLLHGHELEEVFDVVIASSETDYIKPQPEIFQSALDKLEVNAGEAVFIDDATGNVHGARQIGLAAHLFTGNQDLFTFLNSLGVVVRR